jgi:hypothetical protein
MDKIGWLKFFEECGKKCYLPQMRRNWESRDYKNNQWDALCVFMSEYAFARGGTNSPDYPALSVYLLEKAKREGKQPSEEQAGKIWEEWRKSGVGIPKKTTIPLDIRKDSNGGDRVSIIKFVSGISKKEGMSKTLPYYLKDVINNDGISKAHKELMRIVGVKEKIASFYLRDIVYELDVFDSFGNNIAGRELLQPQDRWVNRITNKLFFDIDFYDKCSDNSKNMINQKTVIVAETIVKECNSNTNPEYVNMGMWYFGAVIVKSKFELDKLFKDLESRDDIDKYCKERNWGVWLIE